MAKRKHAPISTESVASSCDCWGRAPSNKTCISAALEACMDAWFLPSGLGESARACCAPANVCKSLHVGFTTSRGHSRADRGGKIYFLLCQMCFRRLSSLKSLNKDGCSDWLQWLVQRLDSRVRLHLSVRKIDHEHLFWTTYPTTQSQRNEIMTSCKSSKACFWAGREFLSALREEERLSSCPQ